MIGRESLYRRLPVRLQDLACSLEGWRLDRSRYGPPYGEVEREVETRASWSAEAVSAFRDARLRAFVAHAAESAPIYRGLDTGGIRGVDDLAALPVLTKREVQDAGAAAASTAVDARACSTAHTSGTTGAGLRFLVTPEAVREQWAVWWRYRHWHGIARGTWCGYLAGRSVVPLSHATPPFWRINAAGRQILFSGYHLSPANLPAYLAELRRRRPPWLHGYPSLLAVLAQHVLDAGGDPGYQVTWITTGAESLLASQRDVIERAFGVAPRQHYGLAEAVANISECERGALHVDEDFAAVEFLPRPDGDGLAIVGTNLSNLATPLVRYDTGDVAQGLGTCGCGRPGRVVTGIDGRREDYILLRGGARLGRMDHVFKDLVNIREAQLRQVRAGEVTALVVRGPRFTAHDEARLRDEFTTRVGAGADLIVEYVDAIPRTASGKLRFVVSEIRDQVIGPPS